MPAVTIKMAGDVTEPHPSHDSLMGYRNPCDFTFVCDVETDVVGSCFVPASRYVDETVLTSVGDTLRVGDMFHWHLCGRHSAVSQMIRGPIMDYIFRDVKGND